MIRRSIIIVILLSAPAMPGEIRLALSDPAVPTPAQLTLVGNGDFSGGSAGWNHVSGDMTAGAVPAGVYSPPGTGNVLKALVTNHATVGMFSQTVPVQGNTAYVLSANLWLLTDSNHKVDVAVVDLNDAGLGSQYGLWEGQLTLYPNMAGVNNGYFVYCVFRTSPETMSVTVRVFYTGFSESDSSWPFYPVGVMWDNIAITPAERFPIPVVVPDPWEDQEPLPPLVLQDPDLNTDGRVDLKDLVSLSSNWQHAARVGDPDIDHDGKTDQQDLQILAASWLSEGVDPSTLEGKVMCGYQGWYNTPSDGAGRGWYHYKRSGRFEPGYCSIDYWPDVGELESEEKYQTAFTLPDGQPAFVYSPFNSRTVRRHFKWMRDSGIDGAFMQRFVVEVSNNTPGRNHFDAVLNSARQGAEQYGRVYAVMYDLSGVGLDQVSRVTNDWKHLTGDLGVAGSNDLRYLHHKGRPVVAVWGIGFNDGRRYTLANCLSLVHDLKECGLTVMVGVPSYWRTLSGDCLNDPLVHQILQAADIVSPWSVGRYSDDSSTDAYTANVWARDARWCYDNNLDYLPVVFPGFSWHNMKPESPSDLIPRRGGQFFWRQFYRCVGAGCRMIYVAMFDEMDEGTAIFKCTSTDAGTPVPVDGSTFLNYKGLPSDHYLWLTGQGRRMLRGQIPLGSSLPDRESP